MRSQFPAPLSLNHIIAHGGWSALDSDAAGRRRLPTAPARCVDRAAGLAGCVERHGGGEELRVSTLLGKEEYKEGGCR